MTRIQESMESAFVGALKTGWIFAFACIFVGCECVPAKPSFPLDKGHLLVIDERTVTADEVGRGSVLRIAMHQNPDFRTAHSAMDLWTRRIMLNNVGESLLRFRNGELFPGLATHWERHVERRQLRLRVPPLIHAHDGTKVTPSFLGERLQNAVQARKDVASFEAFRDIRQIIVEQEEIVVDMHRWNEWLPRLLAEVPLIWRSNERWVGTGPYQIVEQGGKVRLQSFENYWGGSVTSIPHIEFLNEPDRDRSLALLKRGEIDVLSDLSHRHYSDELLSPSLSKFELKESSEGEVWFLLVNGTQGGLGDARLRKAMARLIDRKHLVTVSGELAVPAAGISWPGGPVEATEDNVPLRDPQGAFALLEDVGWVDGDGDGYREFEGSNRALVALTTKDSVVAESVLLDLKRGGFRLQRKIGEPAYLEKQIEQGEFELAFVRLALFSGSDVCPWLSASGAGNWRMQDGEIDGMCQRLRLGVDRKERKKILERLRKRFGEVLPAIPLLRTTTKHLVSERIQGWGEGLRWPSYRELTWSSLQ